MTMSGLSLLRTRLRERAKPILVYSLALLPSILVTLVIASYWSVGWNRSILDQSTEGRVFPWWTDGGNWLKHANAILGVVRQDQELLAPMWEETPFQYPPLFFVILAVAESLFRDPILSIKLVALGCYFIFPLTMYVLSKRTFNSPFAGIVAAWLTAFYPLYLEFMGWGGYPNILGFAALSVAFYYIMNCVGGRSLKDTVCASVLIVVVILAHHLTSLVFLGTLALWAVFSIAQKSSERRTVLVLLLVALSAFLVYRLLFAWPLEYVFFNEAAYHGLRVSVEVYWVFKSPFLSASFSAALLFSIPILIENTRTEGFKSRFLGAWMLTALLGTQGYLLRVALDYNRIFFFLFQPLVLLASACASRISLEKLSSILHDRGKSPWAFARSLKREHSVQLVALAIAILLAVSATLQGLQTVRDIHYWYEGQDPYGDEHKYQAVDWLSGAEVNSVIVAEEPIGRWIEGVSQRRVLLHTPPKFLFMKGEQEREYDARALLTSQYGIRSERGIWIFEQAPYGHLSPIIAFYHLGDYVSSLLLDADDSYVSLQTGSEEEVISLAGAATSVEWGLESESRSSLILTRRMGQIEISEELSLYANQTVVFEFKVLSPANARKVETVLAFNFTDEVILRENPRVYRFEPLALEVKADVGTVLFDTTSAQDYLVVGNTLSRSRQLRLIFGTASFKLVVRLREAEKVNRDVETYTWDEIARKYPCLYLVLPNFAAGTQASATRPEYSHLLNFRLEEREVLALAYQNGHAIILKYTAKLEGG